jgi:diacylglycerol kinase family enzyme
MTRRLRVPVVPEAIDDRPPSTSGPSVASGTGRPRERWLARLAVAAGGLAVLVVAFAPGRTGLLLLLLTVVSTVLTLVGLWLFLAHRGARRAIGAAVAIGAALSVVIAEAVNHRLWVVPAGGALVAVAFTAARTATRTPLAGDPAQRHAAPPVARPFLIMNPRSGGGKVGRFGLRAEAERLRAEAIMVEGPKAVDIADLARKAVGDGADLLGVAGGDGTLGLVAGVAAEHDVPLLVVPAGTRNHFALDLGLAPDDPRASLTALTDGEEIRVDLGDVNGRPFVNNVSLGAYAAIVAQPAYRDAKVATTLDVLPDVLSGQRSAPLTIRADELVVTGVTGVLVSNNPYGTGDPLGNARRARLDLGVLGLVMVTMRNAGEAVTLLRRPGHTGGVITSHAARAVEIDAQGSTVNAGIDGESVVLSTPVQCAVRPAALRVRLPRQRFADERRPEHVTLRRLFKLAGPAGTAHRRDHR